ncbi:DNA-processing protein DprA [Jeotgalicoccus psychrophilus]|uniref:DNA-processing protein DprA n=1 Tax=Jeotgalicoccus psychrophilus TaxID=157228 RepID=UPI000408D150|nr:DNA-processing protein DprA [Jeotgalicoccus psychrophilus]
MDLLLMSYAGVTSKEYLSLLNNGFISPELKRKIEFANTLDRKKIITDLDRLNISYITHEHSLYPPLLKEIYDFPYILYYRGNPRYLMEDMLGVVGSRKSTSYTAKSLEVLLPSLKNIAIISGLAYGADEAAHKTAIGNNMKTIGVLAFGHSTHYPKTTADIRREMEQSHLTISEYPPDTPIRKWQFVARNRIIAGSARGVLVTEAEEKSGSLITLEMALDDNRNAYCLPGNITSALSKGTNLRIKEGASVVTEADDIQRDFD